MVSVLVEKLEFDENELKKHPLNVKLKFVVNGHEGTAAYKYDARLNLYSISDFHVPGLAGDEETKSAAKYFVAQAFQAQLQAIKNKDKIKQFPKK